MYHAPYTRYKVIYHKNGEEVERNFSSLQDILAEYETLENSGEMYLFSDDDFTFILLYEKCGFSDPSILDDDSRSNGYSAQGFESEDAFYSFVEDAFYREEFKDTPLGQHIERNKYVQRKHRVNYCGR